MVSEMQKLQAHEQAMLSSPDQQISLTDPDSRRLLSIATTAAETRQFYPAMKALRSLLPREDRLLAARRPS